MDKRRLLKRYKPGDRNYEILQTLIRSKGVVKYKDLALQSEPNSVKRLLLEQPQIWEKEKVKLKYLVYRLNREMKAGYKIKANQKKCGYVLKSIPFLKRKVETAIDKIC